MTADVELMIDVPRLEERLILDEIKRSGLSLKLTNVKYVPLSWEDKPARVSLIRTISMLRAAYSASIREAAGIKTINSLKAILIAGDKILTIRARARKRAGA